MPGGEKDEDKKEKPPKEQKPAPKAPADENHYKGGKPGRYEIKNEN